MSAEEAGVSAADGRDAAAVSDASEDETACCTKVAMFCMDAGRRNVDVFEFRVGDLGEPDDAGESGRARCIRNGRC